MDVVGVLEFLCEGQLSTYELVQHDSERPEVDCESVSLSQHDFRGHIVRRPNNRKGSKALALGEFLGGSHVYQPQVAVVLDHDVLGLQVPIYDVLHVQVLQAHEH